jgi:hypothetical protein
MSVHLGKMIHTELNNQGRSVTWFAEQLNFNRTNAYNIFKKENLDTELLKRICLILGFNFFQVLCSEMDLSLSKK